MTDIAIKTDTTAIDLSVIKDTNLLAESTALAATVDKKNKLAAVTLAAVEDIRREQAPILYRISAAKLYEKDGFKSMGAYCEAIGFKDSATSQMITAGKVYATKSMPDALKALPVYTLGQMGKLLNNPDEKVRQRVVKDAESGKLNGLTQAAAKKYVDDVKAEMGLVKVQVIKTYTANTEDSGLDPAPKSVDEWEDTIKALWGNVVKAPDIDGHKILIGYNKTIARVFMLTEYTAPKADITARTDILTRVKIVTRKIRRGEDLTDSERDLALSLGLIDEDEDEDEDN